MGMLAQRAFSVGFATFPDVSGGLSGKQDKGYATKSGIPGSQQWAKAHCDNDFSILHLGQVYAAKFRVMRKIMPPNSIIT